jgi:hypothetical protein
MHHFSKGIAQVVAQVDEPALSLGSSPDARVALTSFHRNPLHMVQNASQGDICINYSISEMATLRSVGHRFHSAVVQPYHPFHVLTDLEKALSA